jgi:glycosyltransferase involved in cell wall biosynthesis
VLTINVYAADLGWLFEDLKRLLAGIRLDGVKVISTNEPLRRADAWVTLRTREAGATPDRDRTAVQIADLFDDGMYRPRGIRQGVHGVGALILCHPEQRRILERSGIPLGGVRILERPLGALSHFRVRSVMPDRFRVGWVGRDHWRKRLGWFEQALLERGAASGEPMAVLIGMGLSGAAERLQQGGVPCLHFPRGTYSIFDYPELYPLFDCLVITSSTEAHPLPLFEALATGIPVVSTPVGWAPFFAALAARYVRIATTPQAIRAELDQIRSQRCALFDERHAIARLVEPWHLEDWLIEVVRLAASLSDVASERPG